MTFAWQECKETAADKRELCPIICWFSQTTRDFWLCSLLCCFIQDVAPQERARRHSSPSSRGAKDTLSHPTGTTGGLYATRYVSWSAWRRGASALWQKLALHLPLLLGTFVQASPRLSLLKTLPRGVTMRPYYPTEGVFCQKNAQSQTTDWIDDPNAWLQAAGRECQIVPIWPSK